MIELGDRLNGRWQVRRPFIRGNARNFIFYLVRDEQLDGRPALLKTLRRTDLPAEGLFDWRRRALEAEFQRLGRLTLPSLPEPLDAFELPNGDRAIVYALLGQAQGNFLLREKLQRWGFIFSGRGRCRQIDKIAQLMHDLTRFTEALWRAGFVHANLNPDHLYYLRDGVLRVTGTSALCEYRRDGSSDAPTIAFDEPGLRNLTMGYQGRPHHAAAEAAAAVAAAGAAARAAAAATKRPEAEQAEAARAAMEAASQAAGQNTEPLDAARVRWNSYAALAVDLLWGRDIREYCARMGYSGIELSNRLEEAIFKDFRALESRCLGRSREPGPAALTRPMNRMWELLKLCLNWRSGPLPSDMYENFLQVWDDLDVTDYNDWAVLHKGEAEWRDQRGWNNRLYNDSHFIPPCKEGETGEFLVCDYEEDFSRTTANGQVIRSGRYKVVNLAHPAVKRAELRKLHYDTRPNRAIYLLPGDIIPGEIKKTRPGVVGQVAPSDWAAVPPGPGLRDGQSMRALSLGWRLTTLDQGRAHPWALVEIDGALKTLPVRPANEGQRYNLFPRAGVFFTGVCRIDPRHGRGVVPADLPDLRSALSGWSGHVPVRDRNATLLFFDLPVGESYMVTCVLPLNRCPPTANDTVKPGTLIPVRVEGGSEDSIWVEWDAALGGARAAVGQVYDAQFMHRRGHDRFAVFRFGQSFSEFVGEMPLDRRLPWGLPYRSWQPGNVVPVRVTGEFRDKGQVAYRLEYAGPKQEPGLRVEDVFTPGRAFEDGRVVGHSDLGVHVLIGSGEGPRRLEVEGLLHYRLLQNRYLGDPESTLPVDSTIKVQVVDVDPDKRLIGLQPWFQ